MSLLNSGAGGVLAGTVEEDYRYFDVYILRDDYEMAQRYLKARDQETIDEWKKAAERGLPEGQSLYGWCALIGAGVPEDAQEAVKWFRKAAEQGNAGGQHMLGICYRQGFGVSEDDQEAAGWFRKAAEQGYAAAQYELGKCYYDGLGVPKDDEEAAKWLRKAKKQGHSAAPQLLKKITGPTPGWFENYLTYAFQSLYAFFVYIGIILFTLFREYGIEKGRRRVFAGSKTYIVALCLIPLFYGVLLFSHPFEELRGHFLAFDPGCALFLNALLLLICYIRVSRVPESFVDDERGTFGSMLLGAASMPDTVTKYDIVQAGTSYKVGEKTESENYGCILFVLIVVFGIILAPVLVCIRFLFNYIFVRSA